MNRTTDVAICGGGPAGIGAAVAAARAGARTLLIEMTGRLGGLGQQQMLPFLKLPGDEGGIIREYRERLQGLGALEFVQTPQVAGAVYCPATPRRIGRLRERGRGPAGRQHRPGLNLRPLDEAARQQAL